MMLDGTDLPELRGLCQHQFEMALPAGWIARDTVSPSNRPIEDRLYPSAQPLGRFQLAGPQLLSALFVRVCEDLYDVARRYVSDRDFSDHGVRIGLKAGLPDGGALPAPPTWLLKGDVLCGSHFECDHLGLRVASLMLNGSGRLDGIDAVTDGETCKSSRLPRLKQRYKRVGSEPHVAAPPVGHRCSENPRPAVPVCDLQTQAVNAADGIEPRFRLRFDPFSTANESDLRHLNRTPPTQHKTQQKTCHGLK